MKRKSKIPPKFYNRATLCHIVNTFKDGKVKLITYKYWGIRRQRWHYETIYLWEYESGCKHGLYTLKKDIQYKNQKLF